SANPVVVRSRADARNLAGFVCCQRDIIRVEAHAVVGRVHFQKCVESVVVFARTYLPIPATRQVLVRKVDCLRRPLTVLLDKWLTALQIFNSLWIRRRGRRELPDPLLALLNESVGKMPILRQVTAVGGIAHACLLLDCLALGQIPVVIINRFSISLLAL